MRLDQEPKKKNRITNTVILALALCAVCYCIFYLAESREANRNQDDYRVVISDSIVKEPVGEMEDPYEKRFLPIRVLAGGEEQGRELGLYITGGICYAFLPAYAQMAEVSYVFDETVYEIRLSGREVFSGQVVPELQAETEYELEITEKEQGSLCYTMVFLQSQNLPAVFIDTQSGSMDYVDAYKGNEESGQFCCITADGKTDSEGAMERIRGRGNTSWDGVGAKNQYSVRLRENTDILQMGSAQNWVIQANRLDVSMMRNKLAYDLARDLAMPYAVDSEFADMYFNGNYMGTYLICEKVEAAPNRVDIPAGYLLEANFREDDPERTLKTEFGSFLINSPAEVTQEQYEAIKTYLDKTTRYIMNAAASDAYTEYIDVNSFAKLFLMNELSNDPDANLLSAFFFKEDMSEESRLTAGPAWDFDLAFGNEERGANPLVSAFGESWYARLYQSGRFRAEVSAVLGDFAQMHGRRYQEEYFEDMKRYLGQSYRMNEIRWEEKQGYIASFYPEFEETIGYLRDYYIARFENLADVFMGSEKRHKVDFIKEGQTTHIFVEDGAVIPASVLESMGYFWQEETFRLSDGQKIDPERYRIYGDVSIRCSAGADQEAGVFDRQEAGGVREEDRVREKGDLTMQWISFMMLMVPGLLSVWISGKTKLNRENAFAILTQYFLNSFLVLVLAYGIFYLLYGSAVLSFSDQYSEAYDYSIYNINVAFKYLLLAGALAVMVGIVERIVIKAFGKRKLTKEQIGI